MGENVDGHCLAFRQPVFPRGERGAIRLGISVIVAAERYRFARCLLSAP